MVSCHSASGNGAGVRRLSQPKTLLRSIMRKQRRTGAACRSYVLHKSSGARRFLWKGAPPFSMAGSMAGRRVPIMRQTQAVMPPST